jgi:hypothetical protein
MSSLTVQEIRAKRAELNSNLADLIGHQLGKFTRETEEEIQNVRVELTGLKDAGGKTVSTLVAVFCEVKI